jgi:hypothetical protein
MKMIEDVTGANPENEEQMSKRFKEYVCNF